MKPLKPARPEKCTTSMSLGVVLVGLLCLTIAAPVWAETPGGGVLDPVLRAEELSREGVADYQAGRFKDAIAAMLEARSILSQHGQPPAPELLYNIARIYHKMGEHRLAHESYTRFILVDGADPAMVRKALDYREQVAKLASDASSTGRSETNTAATTAGGEGLDARPLVSTNTTSAPLHSDAAPDRRLAYWLGGAGLVVLSGAAVLGGLAWSADGSLGEQTTYQKKLDAQSRGKALALAADIGMVSGLAVVTTATVLWFLADGDSPGESGALMLSPSLVPGGVGASLNASF